MLIISKFHDYYDPVGKTTGVDKTIVYNRTRAELPVELVQKVHISAGGSWTRSRGEYRRRPKYNFHLIGFCGRIHLCIHCEAYDDQKGKVIPARWAHDQKEVQALVDKHFFSRWSSVKQGLDEMVRSPELLGLFAKHKVPVWQIGMLNSYDHRLVLNPCLKALDFQTVIDPYTAFQEIMMYISGVLGTPSNPMVAVSEKTKVAKHGFDKWSFRKPKKDT